MTLPGGKADLHSTSRNEQNHRKTCLFRAQHSRSDDLVRVRPDGPSGTRLRPSPRVPHLPSHHWLQAPASIPDDLAATESSSSDSCGGGPAICTCGSKSAPPPTLSDRVSRSPLTCQKAAPVGEGCSADTLTFTVKPYQLSPCRPNTSIT